ncbi:hypothetical protein BO71DRAFT_397181 [Aspergillus ellipticus CBS 707.79]|uniref:Uncharacterized protein n=1 Tax=Aspergillus ellipticus CBS 707.79 TaxID=1448320 RepID=A0A319DXU3_9EURO|nr:hypothetical protein BO71DRAFT_397181 [Aspergillus ellipticus CBS 707.79]
MTLQELLLRLSSALMHCTDPDRPEILKMMINAFTKSQQNDLNDLVLRTVLPHKFPMSPSLIFSIITFFRKSGNLRGFNHFLGTLCGDGYPVDMGRLALYLRRTVNGVEIIIPPVHSANPVIYAALIMTCLRFGQPDRADAYLVYARSTGFMDDYATLGAYLKFYTIRKDWEKGVQTMRRTMAFMASSTELATFRIERLIVFMVNLCDACKQYDMSQAIITSAVNSGFDPRMADDQADIVFDYDPDCARWSLAVTPDSRLLENNRPCEKSYAFVDAMSERIAEHEGKPTTKTWQDLMGKYSQEVLSSILASPVADRKTSSSPSSSPSSSSNLSPANVPQDLFDQIRTQAEATKAQSGSTSSAHAEKLKALELDITKLKKGSSAQRLTSLQQEISKLNKDISQFTSHTENHTSLRKEISKLKKDFSNESSVHAQQATSLQQEVSKLKRELYESSEHSHTQELKMLGAEISELKQQVAAEADKVQEITSLRAEIFELKKMVFNFHQPTTKKPTTKKPTTKKPTTTSSRQPTTKNPKTTSSRQTMMKNPTNSSSRQTTTKNPKTTSSRQTTTKNPTTTSSHQTTTKNPTTPSSQTTMEDPTTPSSQTATDDPTTTSSEPSPSQKEGRLADFRRRYPNFLETMIANNSAMTSSQYPDDLSNSQYHAADLEKIGADFTLHDPTTDDSTTTSPQPPRRLSRADRRPGPCLRQRVTQGSRKHGNC